MRRFDTVLFDLDGTLLDTLEDICGAANHTLRELGYPERTLAEMRRFVGNGAEMQMRRALGADADEETVAKALALYKPYYAAHCQIKTKPYAGVLELMAALKAEGFRLAVVSNKPDEAVRPLLAYQEKAVAKAAALGGLLAPGSDAGAWAVRHGQGGLDERKWLREALGEGADAVLARGAAEIRKRF